MDTADSARQLPGRLSASRDERPHRPPSSSNRRDAGRLHAAPRRGREPGSGVTHWSRSVPISLPIPVAIRPDQARSGPGVHRARPRPGVRHPEPAHGSRWPDPGLHRDGLAVELAALQLRPLGPNHLGGCRTGRTLPFQAMPGARESGEVRGRGRPMARNLDRAEPDGDTGEAYQDHQRAGRGDRHEPPSRDGGAVLDGTGSQRHPRGVLTLRHRPGLDLHGTWRAAPNGRTSARTTTRTRDPVEVMRTLAPRGPAARPAAALAAVESPRAATLAATRAASTHRSWAPMQARTQTATARTTSREGRARAASALAYPASVGRYRPARLVVGRGGRGRRWGRAPRRRCGDRLDGTWSNSLADEPGLPATVDRRHPRATVRTTSGRPCRSPP